MRRIYLGRHVYGFAAIAFAVMSFVWHDFGASRLLTAMIIGFQFLIWLPKPFADPHHLISWAGNAQNLAIAGAAWIVTDYLSRTRSPSMAQY